MFTKLKQFVKLNVTNLLLLAIVFSLFVPASSPVTELGASYSASNQAQWYNFNTFTGYQTNVDPSKLPDGGTPMGQNSSINEGDRISNRSYGYEVFPSTSEISTSTDAVMSLHNFRKRGGENILIRTSSTTIEYFEENNDTWEVLKTGLTPAQKFGFADYNINTDIQSYTYFGNAADNAMRWTGVSGVLSSSLNIGDSSIYVEDVDEDEGFVLATGTVIVCGTEIEYSAYNQSTGVFTLTAPSTISCAANRAVAEAVEELPGLPKGNIYLATNNRLFIAGIASTTQAVYFSEYGDATNFVGADLVTDSTATAPGIFNLGEGGGPVTGLIEDEESIYIFKKSVIRRATLTDTLYTLTTLKAFDGRGQTTGSISSTGLFSSGNKVFFITADNQIMGLGRIENVDTPQLTPISETIQETVDDIDFSESAGIVYKNNAYFTGKQSDSSLNNVVFVRNLDLGFWETPVIGWNVSQFVVYDDGEGEDLYFSAANLNNVYKVVDETVDGEGDVLSNWRSKSFTFGMESVEKEVVDMYVEGYITDNTELNISLLADENGYTQSLKTSIKGTDATYLFSQEDYNAFGLSPFGRKRFGSDDIVSNMKRFRVYLGKDFRVQPFYALQVEFLSDGQGQNWEVTSFGFKVRAHSEETKRTLYKSFKE